MTDSHPLQIDTPPPKAELPSWPKRYWPPATLTLIAITCLVFLLTELAGGSSEPQVLIEFGAAYGPLLRKGQFWRLVMPLFLHIGLMHLFVNMFSLYVLGPPLERVYGYGRFSFIYVISGIAGSIVSMTAGNDISAGASGAILGIAGAMLVTGVKHPEAVPRRMKLIFGWLLLAMVVLQFASAWFIRDMDNWAHLGGLVGGAILAAVVPPPSSATIGGRKPSQALVWIPILIVVVSTGADYRSYLVAKQVGRFLVEGAQMLAAHKNDQALDRFKRATELSPNDARAHEGLGSAYLDLNRGAEAESEFKQTLKLDPKSPSAQLGLALAYRQQGKLDEFKAAFAELIKQRLSTPEGQLGLADMLAQRKLYAPAIQRYEALLQANPKIALAHNNLAWLYATCDDPKYRNPQQALEHALKAVELTQWKQANVIDTLAEALYASQKYDQAVQTQAKALALDPNNQEFKDHMARYREAASKGTATGPS